MKPITTKRKRDYRKKGQIYGSSSGLLEKKATLTMTEESLEES